MTELWQQYDEQGLPIPGKALSKAENAKGALHAASHVWIWRSSPDGPEILLQRRATTARTWQGHLDISAAGHVDAGEDPLTAALRETAEELGHDLAPSDLTNIGVQRALLHDDSGIIENEFEWLYIYEIPIGIEFKLQESEVHSVEWRSLERVRKEALAPQQRHPDRYVPHSPAYYMAVLEAIEAASSGRLHPHANTEAPSQ
jgi:8-oxo-dGTP pyrophosphatase MutT (NUDIX family)